MWVVSVVWRVRVGRKGVVWRVRIDRNGVVRRRRERGQG